MASKASKVGRSEEVINIARADTAAPILDLDRLGIDTIRQKIA